MAFRIVRIPKQVLTTLVPLAIAGCSHPAPHGDKDPFSSGGPPKGVDTGSSSSAGGTPTSAVAPSAPEEGGAATSVEDASASFDFHSAFGLLETVAGTGKSDSGNEWRAEFEGGPATQAELSRPHMAQADAAGNIYIADKESHAIRRVDPSGRITTVAGINRPGDGEDGERPATEVALSSPNGLWVSPDGTYYILDLDNGKIRKVTPDGIMRTLFRVKSGTDVGRGLWVAPDESEVLVCAGTQLLRWRPSSGTQVVVGGFTELGTVFEDDSGTIWIGDRGASRVYQILGNEKRAYAGSGLEGPFVEGSHALDTPMPGARAVWPYQGGLFVGLHEGSRVIYVDASGVAHIFLNGAKDAHGGDGERFDSRGKKVSELRSVTIAPSGDVIVVESDLGFVRVVRAVRP